MSSDGRYIYHHQPGMHTPYDYSSYPPPPLPSYDNAQMAQLPTRPMRSASSSQPHPQPQPQSPHQPAQYNAPPQSPYPPPAYGPGAYMTHPSQAPQWSTDSWAHYNQTYPPQHPPQQPPPPPVESHYNTGPSRPEPVPISPAESRGYINNNPDPRRMEERQPPNPQPPQPAPRRREKESSPTAISPDTQTGLDFMKLLDSYRLIIEATESSIAPGRPLPADTLERMLQSATYGVQMLESATLQQESQQLEMRSPKDKDPEETKGSPNGTAASSKRQKAEDTVQEGQTCLGCNATSTPEWRRGPMGPRTLCNACGLVYAKLIKKRVRERASGKTNGQNTGSHGLEDSGDSDDDDEYGSPDRHSEVGDGGRD